MLCVIQHQFHALLSGTIAKGCRRKNDEQVANSLGWDGMGLQRI